MLFNIYSVFLLHCNDKTFTKVQNCLHNSGYKQVLNFLSQLISKLKTSKLVKVPSSVITHFKFYLLTS